ncbi:hypothetical protein RF11_13302 [Thelohanellus kitauei]|uniref:Uncharacterized protein n=1 Tax=Thelohanellus kitauei TaxID=669202 RepID=A0A0C2NDJ8_THEKT|nr:hypothetical protein RF11_13302 [Thelohanellus kitauei]
MSIFWIREKYPFKLKSSLKRYRNKTFGFVFNAVIFWLTLVFTIFLWSLQSYNTVIYFDDPYDMYLMCHFSQYVYCEHTTINYVGRYYDCGILKNDLNGVTCSNLGDHLQSVSVCNTASYVRDQLL